MNIPFFCSAKKSVVIHRAISLSKLHAVSNRSHHQIQLSKLLTFFSYFFFFLNSLQTCRTKEKIRYASNLNFKLFSFFNKTKYYKLKQIRFM